MNDSDQQSQSRGKDELAETVLIDSTEMAKRAKAASGPSMLVIVGGVVILALIGAAAIFLLS